MEQRTEIRGSAATYVHQTAVPKDVTATVQWQALSDIFICLRGADDKILASLEVGEAIRQEIDGRVSLSGDFVFRSEQEKTLTLGLWLRLAAQLRIQAQWIEAMANGPARIVPDDK